MLAGRHLRVEAAAFDGQRESTLDVVARAHAARAYDASGGIEGEIRIAVVNRQIEMVARAVAVAHVIEADRRGHLDAARICRPPCTRKGRADGPTCRVPSRCGGAWRAVRFACGPSCRLRRAWCMRPEHPLRPSISMRHRRQEPKLRANRSRTDLRNRNIGERSGAHYRGAGGNSDLAAVDFERDESWRESRAGVPIIFIVDC